MDIGIMNHNIILRNMYTQYLKNAIIRKGVFSNKYLKKIFSL